MTYKSFLAWIKNILKEDTMTQNTPQNSVQAPQTSANALKLYTEAKDCLGSHITLDAAVPAALGCAEAVSYCLYYTNKSVPAIGLQGTMALYKWMLTHSDLFVQTTTPTVGTIIVSPTGMGKNSTDHGHTGICGEYGILSNESQSGLFREQWTLEAWQAYYVKALGFPVFFFNLK
jgi:hypothetical protein